MASTRELARLPTTQHPVACSLVKMKTICIGLYLVLVAMAGIAWAEDDVMVVDVRGDQVRYASGDKTGRAIAAADFLNSGDRIEIAEGASVVLNYFASGIREEITGPAVLVIGVEKSVMEGSGNLKSKTSAYSPKRPLLDDEDKEHSGTVIMRDMKPPDEELLIKSVP